jgi:MoxR-like ATPase
MVQDVTRICNEMSKAVIGQAEVVDQVVLSLLAGGHVLVEGVPGLGKTLLVLALARTFGGRFARIQFTPDLMPSDVTGHAMYDMATGKFTIRKGPAFTNLLLADEINRAPAKTQAALLEVMQEQQITIEGEPLILDKPFMTVATQNPIEQEGTYPLPEAQLDRFLMKIVMQYPSEAEEVQLLRQVTTASVGEKLNVDAVECVMSPARLIELQRCVAHILVDDRIFDYAVRIVRTTRAWQGVLLGAGSRACIALIRVGRAAAVLAGRDFVLPDDLKKIARPVLRHRLTLSPELQIEGHSADDVLKSLLEQVEAPRM